MANVFFSLRFRLALLVLLTCVPLVAITLYTASQERRSLLHDWERRSQEMMELAAREEQQIIAETRQFLLALTESSAVRSANPRECKAQLDDFLSRYPRYANLGVVDTNGMVLASARPVEPVEQTGRLYFNRACAKRAFTVGEFQDHQPAGKRTVHFGSPVLDSKGQVLAVVFAALDLDWVSRFESGLASKLPEGATWTEMDRYGKAVLRLPVPEKWGTQPRPDKALLEAVFARNHGVIEAKSLDGTSGFQAFAAMHSQLLDDEVVTVLGSVPKAVLFAEANFRLAANLIWLGIGACVAFILGSISSQFLVLQPIHALVRSSERLAAGDLTTRTGLAPSAGELGQLTRAFDQMAQALEHREAERQSTDQALKSSELRYRRLFETAHDGILIVDAATAQIIDVNRSLTDLLGWAREQLVGKPFWQTMPLEDGILSPASWQELEREISVRYEDVALKTASGARMHVELVASAYQADGRRVIQCSFRDITERKQAEIRQREARLNLQALSQRLVRVQETERRHLARELHDEIGQALTVIELNLQALQESTDPAVAGPRLRDSLEVVAHVQEQVRDLSLSLRPSMLDDLGLEPALRWYAGRQAALAGLHAEVQADLAGRRLDPSLETECFRIAQEALNNVVKHARARRVTLELRQSEQQLHLSVRDDGIGFNVANGRRQAVAGSSLGLLSMEERAILAGGGLQYNSAPGRGTEVHAWFPLKWAETSIILKL